ncbi:MAG: TonB-dependent receptor plug domain-containing protein [Candidatus Zhuqueibacterota bacterium]
MSRFQLYIVLLTLALLLPSGYAQEVYPAKSDSGVQYFRLQEIVIYGNRDKVNQCTVLELDQQQMKTRNSTTVSELLSFEPGLNLTSGYKSETETRIRGFRSSDVLVLMDGRPINPGYYGRVDLSMLPLDNLAKVTVIKGPASVAYGANAMGGVINIVTQNGMENPRTVVEAKLGDYQYRSINLNHSRQIGRFNYWISGYEHHANGLAMSREFEPTKYEDGGKRELSRYHKLGISGKVGFSPHDNLWLTLSSDYHWAKKDIPVATRFVPGDTPRYWRFPNWERYSLALSGEWKLNSGLSMKSIIFTDAYNDRLINYLTAEMDEDYIDYDSLLENFTTGGLVQGEYFPSPRHHLLVGVQFRRDQMDKKPDLNEPWENHFASTGSFYAQDDFKPWEKTLVTLGVGYFYHRTEVGPGSGNVTPMASIQQQLWHDWNLFASYSQAVRFPTLHQLYSVTSGNSELQPEYANKFELGVKKIFGSSHPHRFLSVDLALFYNELEDMIYRSSRSLRYKNISRSTMQGVEFRMNYSVNRYVSGELSYSFIDFPQPTMEIDEYLPANKFRGMVTVKSNVGTKLSYEAAYVDERLFYYTSTFFTVMPDFYIHNVNVSQEITQWLSVRLEVSNLLDKYYEEEFGYPQPGRQVLGGIRFIF